MRVGGGTGTAIPPLLRRIPAIVGIILLAAALWAVRSEFSQLRIDEIGQEIRNIPRTWLTLAVAATVLAYGVLTIYDRLGTIYAGHPLPYRRVAFASFCAYALSHNLGFSAVSGAAVRFRLYSHWGLSPGEIAKVIGFCSLTFGLGGMVLGGGVLIGASGQMPFISHDVPRAALVALGGALWATVAGYVIVAGYFGRIRLRRHVIELPGFRMALLQVALASADVAVTATVLWLLLPAAPGLSWPVYLGVYVAAYSAGLIASLPGGLGVFDTGVLLGLSPYLPASRIIAGVAIYRLLYYVIPLFLAGGLFAANEVVLRGAALMPGGRAPWVPRWSEPDFSAAAASGAVAISGILLLGVGLLAPRHVALVSAAIATQAGEFVPSLVGAGLIVMAIGLARRVNLAWYASLCLLAVGMVLTLAQGERLWPIAVLGLAMLVLAPFRSLFYRHARLLSGPLDQAAAVSVLVLAVCGVVLAGFRGHVHGPFWRVVLYAGEPWGLRASLALVVTLALAAVWLLLRPGRVRWRPWDVEAQLRLLMMGATPPDHADGLMFGEAERAGVPFLRLDGVILGLGDPAGLAADRVSVIWRLSDLARQEGRDPAFWPVGPELLKIYNDLGLTALPLGADGMPVREAPGRGERYLVCVAERDFEKLAGALPAVRRGLGGVSVSLGLAP